MRADAAAREKDEAQRLERERLAKEAEERRQAELRRQAAETQRQFDEAVDFFDWDRSRAWYMDIAHSNRDFIYAISKKNNCIFKKFINRGDDIYLRGREKYEELAFQYWCMTPPVGKLCQHTSGAASTRKK